MLIRCRLIKQHPLSFNQTTPAVVYQTTSAVV